MKSEMIYTIETKSETTITKRLLGVMETGALMQY